MNPSCGECSPANLAPDAAANLARDFSRRDFVKLFALATFSSGVLAGPGRLLAGLTATDLNEGIYTIRVSDFPVLANDFGSILLKVAGMPSSFASVIITRLSATQFATVTSVCTHQGCTVGTYNTTLNVLACPCHGSRFAPTGSVILGPAALPLASYKTTFDGTNQLSIEIPGLAYRVDVFPAPGSQRLRLQFKTASSSPILKYEVRFRPALGKGEWTKVNFSKTQGGALTETVLNGNGLNANIFVEPTGDAGFYSIIRY